MLRGSKTPLKVKENESGCPEQKEKASFPPSGGQKSSKVTKSKGIRPSRKENVTDGNQTRPPKRALKCPKGPEENLCPLQGSDVSWQLPGSCFGVLREPLLPLHTTEDFSSSQAVPLGNDFSTPERDKVEGNPDFGLSEERKKPVDFAAEFGMAQEGFGKGPTGTSPTSLKLRRRSTIGLRGSPENNTLIRYLAQQRSSRQKETFTQISPFNPANVRSLKDKIDAFQSSFESLQESEGEAGLSHLGKPSQQRSSSQNKEHFKKQPDLEQWSDKFMLGSRGTALKENLSENGTKSSRSELRICSILSPHRAVTVTDSAAAKEWVSEQQNPLKSLETAVTRDTLETEHGARCDHSGSNAVSDVSLGVLGGNQTPVTPLGTGNIPSHDLSQSSSLLRSILKKTPGMELCESPKECSNSAIDRGEGKSAATSDCVEDFETLQTETTDSQNSKTPKKKKVTFGEVLSPEIFDQSLPANTPLRRGASPGQITRARPDLSEEPLPLLDFGCFDEGVEPLPEFLEGSVAAEAPSRVENAEAETDMKTTRSSPKRKCRAVAEATQSSWGAPESDKDTKNPRRSKNQRQKNQTTAALKKSQKTKRRKKVKKALYFEREMASKKPLLSPIPEIPEVFSFVSSPDSPRTDALFTEDAALGDPSSRAACRAPAQAAGTSGKGLNAAAECPSPGLLEEAAAPSSGPELPGSLESSGTAPEFSKAVPVTEVNLDPSECLQQGEECPPKNPARGDPARRRRRSSSSTFTFPPVENMEITGADVAVCSYNVEEVLSVPRAREGSLQRCRRSCRSSSAELRVRRSMRLSRDAQSEGLAWIEIPQIPLPAAPKVRRSFSTSLLAGAENIQLRKQNLVQLSAPGKENESAPLAAAPGRGWRRKKPLKESFIEREQEGKW